MLSYTGNSLPHTQYIPFDLGALEITKFAAVSRQRKRKLSSSYKVNWRGFGKREGCFILKTSCTQSLFLVKDSCFISILNILYRGGGLVHWSY